VGVSRNEFLARAALPSNRPVVEPGNSWSICRPALRVQGGAGRWAEPHSHRRRVEADLVDQLFNSSEKRLARALLLLARYGKQEEPHRVAPKISQEVLAEMIGTTRSRVNFFMNKFRKLGFIEYNGGLKFHISLLSVVLHD
jgi:hypothetical protein